MRTLDRECARGKTVVEGPSKVEKGGNELKSSLLRGGPTGAGMNKDGGRDDIINFSYTERSGGILQEETRKGTNEDRQVWEHFFSYHRSWCAGRGERGGQAGRNLIRRVQNKEPGFGAGFGYGDGCAAEARVAVSKKRVSISHGERRGGGKTTLKNRYLRRLEREIMDRL